MTRTDAPAAASRRHSSPSQAVDAPVSSAALVIMYIAAYVALDWISYLYPIAPFAITPWNPPPGLTIALLTIAGLRYWPAVFIAVLLAELLVRGGGVQPIATAVTSLAFAVGYLALSAILVRVLPFDPRLTRVRDVVWLVVVAVNGTVLVAGLYVGLLVMAGAMAAGDAFAAGFRLWLGDSIGIIVTAPLLMLIFTREARSEPAHPDNRWQPAEIVAQAIAVIAALVAVFIVGDGSESRYFYLLFIPLIWASLRHGLRGAVGCLLVTQLGLVIGFHSAQHSQGEVLELQLLMLAIAITGLMLGAAVSEASDAAAVHAARANELRALEARLQAQELELERTLRFASVGELASGLAHELNQPLAAIGNYVRSCKLMIEARRDGDPKLEQTMDRTLGEVNRAAEVVRRLREYFRSGILRTERVGVLSLAATAHLLERAQRNAITIEQAIGSEVSDVIVDRVQLEIVFHNLVGNAIDALSEPDLDIRRIVIGAKLRDSQFVECWVEDSGPGVSAMDTSVLFQPLSSNKPNGMGLGLSICRSIIEGHGGRLWAEPLPRGVAFHFTVPRADGPAPHDA